MVWAKVNQLGVYVAFMTNTTYFISRRPCYPPFATLSTCYPATDLTCVGAERPPHVKPSIVVHRVTVLARLCSYQWLDANQESNTYLFDLEFFKSGIHDFKKNKKEIRKWKWDSNCTYRTILIGKGHNISDIFFLNLHRKKICIYIYICANKLCQKCHISK